LNPWISTIVDHWFPYIYDFVPNNAIIDGGSNMYDKGNEVMCNLCIKQ